MAWYPNWNMTSAELEKIGMIGKQQPDIYKCPCGYCRGRLFDPVECLFTKNDFEELKNKILSFFGDETKAWAWYETKNPLLGGISPLDMILMGRISKLLKIVKDCQDGNHA